MKSILFLTQILPYPLDAGPKLRAYYVLRCLSRGYNITLISFRRKNDQPKAIEHLEQICEQVITIPIRRSPWRDGIALLISFLFSQPFLITRDQEAAMYSRINHLIANRTTPYNAIHSDQLWMAPYALAAKQAQQGSGARSLIVLDQHNAVHRIPNQMANNRRFPLAGGIMRRESRLLEAYEIKMCSYFDKIVWVTEQDKMALDFPRKEERSMVIPIGLDPNTIQRVKQLTVEPNLLFIGGMHWPPNAEGALWFTDRVLPLVKEKIPYIHFFAIGKSPPPTLKDKEGVTAVGYLQDISPYWEQCRIFIVPLLSGGGMRVKILDAWGHGLPVVSTSIGAEGIGCRHGDNIWIADTPQEFANAICNLISQPGLAERIGSNGLSTLRENYDWRQLYTQWDSIY